MTEQEKLQSEAEAWLNENCKAKDWSEESNQVKDFIHASDVFLYMTSFAAKKLEEQSRGELSEDDLDLWARRFVQANNHDRTKQMLLEVLKYQRANADVELSDALDFLKRRRETRIDTDDLCGGTQRHAGFNEAVIQLEKYVKSKLTNKEQK